MNYNTDNKTDTIYQPTIYQYANIIIDISHESVDKTFQYRIPEHLLGQITAGQQVYIPFGAGSHKRKGYVVELTNQTEYDISKIKEIDSLVEGSITAQSQLIHLAWWSAGKHPGTVPADRAGLVDEGTVWFYYEPGIKNSASGEAKGAGSA